MTITTDKPRRPLGTVAATALVVGNMIGSGVFLLPSSLAAYGGISIVGWLFTAVGALLLALVFASLGRRHPRTGGPYAYARKAFGDFVGFQTAWGYWIAVWVGNAAISVAFVGYLAHFWPALNDDKILAVAVALVAIWLLTGINVWGVRQGGIVQSLTTVMKLVPLVGIAVIGMFFVNGDHFTPFNASSEGPFGAVSTVATLTLWAFIGLESATVPAEDVRDPERTIPRATMLGTVIAAVVYILGTTAVLGIVPLDSLAESTAPFADAATRMFGGWAGDVVAVGAIISAFGALNGWILLQGQVPLAAARDGLFPRSFARLTRSGSPWVGLVVSSVLVTGLMVMNYNSTLVDQFNLVILLATLTTLIPYAYSAAAEVSLMATDRTAVPRGRFAMKVIIALLAFGYSVWTIAGSGYEVVYKGTLLMLAGIPVYLWMRMRSAPSGQPVLTLTPPDVTRVPEPPHSDLRRPAGRRDPSDACRLTREFRR